MPSQSPSLWSLIDDQLSARDRPEPVSDDGDWLRQVRYSRVVDATCAVATAGRGIHRVLVQGDRCRTVDDALRSLGDALELPSYYGLNLDALDECLRDLLELENGRLGSVFGDRIGRDAEGILLTVDRAERLLGDAPVGSLDRLLGALRRAARPAPDPLGRTTPEMASFNVLLFIRSHLD